MDKHDEQVVERVARALYPIFGGFVTGRFPPSSYDDTLEENREAARALARAALTAYTASQSTRDEETVERVARAIYEGGLPKGGRDYVAWEDLDSEGFYAQHDLAMKQARAALSAMPRDEAALADLALDYLHLAQPEFCSARCPSVGREGEPIPHLPECVSMRSLLDGLPFATPGATISTGLMAKLKKLANYLTEQGEYEACDLIDTVVDRLSASPPTPARDEALSFQSRVQPWMMACFGAEIAADKLERADRFIEEALELCQTAPGFSIDRAHALVDYVFNRPQGDINQEVGGVMVTLAAFCLAFELNMHRAGETELARVWTKVEQIRAKQAAKPKGSALPIAQEPRS